MAELPLSAGDLTEQEALHGVRYREYKILLRADRFDKPERFQEFWKIARQTAKKLGVSIEDGPAHAAHHIRDVIFYDTPGHDLYRSAFILRKRQYWEDGFPSPEFELTLKFRHPNAAAAGVLAMQPTVKCDYVIKFKEEILPGKEAPGTMRSIFSHNAVLDTPHIPFDQTLGKLQRLFPATAMIRADSEQPIRVVNDVYIEEVQGDLGHLDFGNKYSAKADIAIWRWRANGQPLIGEFAFQCKFRDYLTIGEGAKELSEAFYKQVQLDALEWLCEGTTKTRMIYEMANHPVECHE